MQAVKKCMPIFEVFENKKHLKITQHTVFIFWLKIHSENFLLYCNSSILQYTLSAYILLNCRVVSNWRRWTLKSVSW